MNVSSILPEPIPHPRRPSKKWTLSLTHSPQGLDLVRNARCFPPAAQAANSDDLNSILLPRLKIQTQQHFSEPALADSPPKLILERINCLVQDGDRHKPRAINDGRAFGLRTVRRVADVVSTVVVGGRHGARDRLIERRRPGESGGGC